MTLRRPCPDGRHRMVVDLTGMVCERCSLRVSQVALDRATTLRQALQNAEREWYIKELES